MDRTPTDKDILELMTVQERHSTVVSIYLPSYSQMMPDEIENEATAFRKTVHSVLLEVTSRHMIDEERGMISSLLLMLADDYTSWRSARHAMALFISPEDARMFIIPIQCDGLVHVGSRFVLAPLMVAANMLEEDYLLHIDVYRPRLYRVTLASLEFEVLGDVFGDESFLAAHENDVSRGRFSIWRHKPARLSFEEEVQRIREIDQLLRRTALPESARILLAGAKEHIDTLKRVSRFSFSSEIVLEGRREHKLYELQERVHDRLQARLRRMAGEFRDLFVAAGDMHRATSEDIGGLHDAASSGGVRTLSLTLFELPKMKRRSPRIISPRINLSLEYQQIEQLEEITQNVFRNHGNVIGAFLKRKKPHMMFALTR